MNLKVGDFFCSLKVTRCHTKEFLIEKVVPDKPAIVLLRMCVAGMMGVNMAMGQCATRSTSYQTVLSWLPGEINTHGRSKDIKIVFLLSNFEIINLSIVFS